jgi:hypothetical protein
MSGTGASAHRFDEYLQAARIAVEPEGVQLALDLTPGMAVADPLIRAIDADQNGALSDVEQGAYARSVLNAIVIVVDGGPPLRVALAAFTFPDAELLRTGDRAIGIRAVAPIPRLADGAHQIAFRNQSTAEKSVFLANALLPDGDEVRVTGQRRDTIQSELTIEVVVRSTPTGWARRWLWAGFAVAMMLVLPAAQRRVKRSYWRRAAGTTLRTILASCRASIGLVR